MEMTGILIGGALLSLPGLGGVFLGLMFLIASRGSSSRLIPGFIFLICGGGLLFIGLRLFIKGLKQSSLFLDKAVRASAVKHNGEVGGKTLFAEIGPSSASEAFIEEKVRSGEIKKENRDGIVYYLFPSFQFRLKTKYCPYCGKDYPVRENIETCPACGGDLKLRETGNSKGDDYFSMDG